MAASVCCHGQAAQHRLPHNHWDHAARNAFIRCLVISTARCKGHPRNGVRAACLAPSGDPKTVSIEPDVVLRSPDGGRRAHLFGTSHNSTRPGIGEYILQLAPHVVVLETALTPSHGAATGNTFSCSEPQPCRDSAVYQRTFCGLAAQLTATTQPPQDTPLWWQLQRQMPPEMLAAVAALCVPSRLVFGDRPKQITIQRLFALSSLNELDDAFAAQSLRNYEELLTGEEVAPCGDDGSDVGTFDRVMMREREAVMCACIHDAMLRTPPSDRVADVVAVVGSDHLPGIERLWTTQEWKTYAGPTSTHAAQHSMLEDAAAQHDLWKVPPTQGPTDPVHNAVKRALLEAALGLRCARPVVDMAKDVLRTLPHDERVYEMVHELYGSPRMLMAVLPRAALDKVCIGWRCDMWEVLQPLRDVRPVNGGCGFDEDLVLELRSLHFELT